MTNVDATEDDLRAAAEVLKLAAILDDRCTGPDKARIAAWAEQIHRHQLERGDLVDGLQDFYDVPHDHAIQIGDLIAAARARRRDRNEREDAADRERRQQWHDANAADQVRAIADTVTAPPPGGRPTTRLERAQLALQTCMGRAECQPAIAEYHAALRPPKKGTAA